MTDPLTRLAPASFAFGPFVLMPQRQALFRNGQPVRLGSRAFDILTVLVSKAGQLVSKRELMAQVWPDSVVDDGALKVHMVTLRRALGDEPNFPEYIATATGRGYRFTAPVRRGTEQELVPALHAQSARRHNLPARAATLLGRGEVVEHLIDEMGQCRLMSIVGAGGSGKSAVALAVAEGLLNLFPDGVWHADLTTLRAAGSLPTLMASMLGFENPQGFTISAVASRLRNRHILLVLDGCEHLIDEVARTAAQLLASVPMLKILVTSREPLQIDGECVRRLHGLELPPDPSNLTAKEALNYSAIQLFAERAAYSSEQFVLTDTNAATVSAICRSLDALPLAIDLAASRVAVLGLGQLLGRIDAGIHALAERRAGPERHRTLMANVEWSCSLLSDAESAALQAVSSFDGEFDLARAVSAARLPPSDGAELLGKLVRKSLAVISHDEAGVSYRLLHMARLYGSQIAGRSGYVPSV